MAEAEATERRWTEGEYTLLSGLYVDHKSGVHYHRGDAVSLDRADAVRLGNAGSIAPVDSDQGEAARTGEDPRKRERIRELEAELARLKGEDQGEAAAE